MFASNPVGYNLTFPPIQATARAEKRSDGSPVSGERGFANRLNAIEKHGQVTFSDSLVLGRARAVVHGVSSFVQDARYRRAGCASLAREPSRMRAGRGQVCVNVQD